MAVVLLALCTVTAQAQVQLLPFTKSQFFDANGRPLAGGCIFTTVSGGTTPLASYTDFTGGTPNTNPVILDSAGRANIWLSGSAYRIRLATHGGTNCASGVTLWTEDGINPSPASLLASNNVWSGTNTWNAASLFNSTVNFTVGFTSSGPSNLNSGGAFVGTFSGSPIFSGTPNFSNGFLATTGSFSGQITSTVSTGTAPFVIASTTQVTNLNTSLLEGATWEIPGTIGSTTPNTGVFTHLTANTDLTINGGTAQTGTQGTDTKLLTAGTVTAGAGHTLCTDAQSGATTSGCSSSGFTQIEAATVSSPCTPGSSNSFDACVSTVTWPHSFADTSYVMTCTAQGTGYNTGVAANNNANLIYVSSQSTGTAVIIIQNGRGSADTPTKVFCIGVHP